MLSMHDVKDSVVTTCLHYERSLRIYREQRCHFHKRRKFETVSNSPSVKFSLYESTIGMMLDKNSI